MFPPVLSSRRKPGPIHPRDGLPGETRIWTTLGPGFRRDDECRTTHEFRTSESGHELVAATQEYGVTTRRISANRKMVGRALITTSSLGLVAIVFAQILYSFNVTAVGFETW